MNKYVYSMLGLLVVQYLLGMGLNVVGKPEADTATLLKITAYVLIALHILNAIVLVTRGSIFWSRLRRGTDGFAGRRAAQGLLSLSLAMVFGLMTVTLPGEELWSFLMSVGFLAAFISYGRILLVRPASTQ